MVPDILQDAEDIAIVAHPESDRYIFAAKPSLAFQKRAFERSIANAGERNIPAFQAHWQFDEEVGITGLSTYLALRLDEKVLRPQGLWIPGLLEAKALQEQGKLENGVYRDYGVTVLSDAGPNKSHAHALISQAGQLKLPFVVPFRALTYRLAGKNIEDFE